MTPNEAHEYMENEIRCVQRSKFCDRVCNKCELVKEDKPLIEAYGVAVLAIEKQIPKKPRREIWVDDEKRKGDVRLATKDDVLTKDNHDTITHCPNCDEWVTVQKYLSPPKYDLFCRNCGQALDWSENQ